MAKSRVMFVCQDCGSEQNKWIGQCPDCNAWNTLVQFAQPAGPTAARAAAGRRGGYAGETAALRTLAEIERAAIDAALEACGGNRSEAARRLGIGRNTLLRKLAAAG